MEYIYIVWMALGRGDPILHFREKASPEWWKGGRGIYMKNSYFGPNSPTPSP
jgi:hypothetical protein